MIRRDVITETAPSTALSTSYMADQLSLFSLVVGSHCSFLPAIGGALRRGRAAA